MRISDKKNKWLKYRFMKNSERLARYMPETMLMTPDAFWELMAKYNRVIVKPIGGSRGRGVIKVSRLNNDHFELHHENQKITLRGKDRTYQFLKRNIGSERYMVQRYISRAKINSRAFDMRVIVQRKRHSDAWRVTGKIAKLTGRGYIVSNITRSRGTLLRVKTAIKRSSLKGFSHRALQSEMKKAAIRTAEKLRALFPRHRIYGLDMAFDKGGQVWIIEANLFPSMSHFIKSRNRATYRRIIAYKKG